MKLLEQHDFNDATELRSYLEQHFPQSAGERKFTANGREVEVDGLSVHIYEADESEPTETAEDSPAPGEEPAAEAAGEEDAPLPNVTEFPSPEARAEGEAESPE